ncbi:MAG: SRPBCC family protein [Actinomycetota bacterium]|nr:SRPBCC family protein [Actinomycetota bacterium]
MAEHSEVMPVAADVCFDTVTAFESYPTWMQAFKDVTVLERAGDTVTVEFRVDAKLREVRYVLRHKLERSHRISWDYVEGDAKDVDGQWLFEDLGNQSTRCTYRVSFDVGGFVPGSVKKALAEQAVRSSLDALRSRLTG